MQGLALVDYYNFRALDRSSRADMELDTAVLLDDVARGFVAIFPDTRELDVRLYGGWTNEGGLPSRDASRLYEILPNHRGRRHGVIVRPTLATSMILFPEFVLRGTVRGEGRNRRQKMVDGMIGCDAIGLATDGISYVAIVTDDDDLLPAAIFANHTNADVLVWMRAREIGTAMNDDSLLSQGLRFHELRV